MTDEEMLAEIFRIYEPAEQRPNPGYRVYYDADTSVIICFSQDELPHPYCQVTKEVYETYRPDLFKIEDGKVVAIKQADAPALQLTRGGNVLFSLPNDMQFAVSRDHNGDKDNWN